MLNQRNYQALKTLADYSVLDAPIRIPVAQPPSPPRHTMYILRMLVRAKYGTMKIPRGLWWLNSTINRLADFDANYTGIGASWCYVTIRHGIPRSVTDDEWHFDGSSFRVEIIPERNYVSVNHTPTEYKVGRLNIPDDFDPLKHNLFRFAAAQLIDAPTLTTQPNQWYLLNPFCLHRRPPVVPPVSRTFIRICFTDIEGRDINNTPNSRLSTPAFGRDPVKSFRDKLTDYAPEAS